MSFFINFRNSVTPNRKINQKNNSSAVKINASRSKSVINCYRNSSNRKKDNKKLNNIQSTSNLISKDEEDTRSIGSLMRSETFTIEDHRKKETEKTQQRRSSIKDTMFEKFTTFTRRKKSSPAPEVPKANIENETLNTYKRWPTPTDNIEVTVPTPNTDPFNCLYDKRSSMKSDQSSSERGSVIDCGTYRKNKLPTEIKERLEELKSHPESLNENENENHENENDERDKYKTVTINSFRKSFREKFLAQQKQSPAYNPSWFVEVEPPPTKSITDQNNENYVRPDILVFNNDDYRSTARSPVRDKSNSPVRRSASRPNLQRQETFKVDRPDEQPSIRIEIKNSITPNEPGRIVPVGVAKPIQSFNNNENWPQPTDQYQAYQQQNQTSGYQTRIQIKQDPKYQLTTNNYTGQRQSRPAQRQTSRTQITSSPSSGVQKFNGYSNNRYISNNYTPLSSYDIIKNNSNNNIPAYGFAKTNNQTPTQQNQCYFGDNLLRQQNYNSRIQTVDSGTGVAAVDSGRKKWNKPSTIQQQVYQQQREQIQQQLQPQQQRKQWIKPSQNQQFHQDMLKPGYLEQKPKTGFTGYLSNKWNRKEPNYSSNNTGIFTTTNSINQQQQNRRSRSPIKIPWR